MTCCRSDRFFAYSDTAIHDPQFAEYKEKLEHKLKMFDLNTNVQFYTPHVATLLLTLVTGIEAGLVNKSSYSLMFNILQIGIPIVGSGILGISRLAKNQLRSSAYDLIASGVKLKFFKLGPPVLEEISANTALLSHHTDEIHADALIHRMRI